MSNKKRPRRNETVLDTQSQDTRRQPSHLVCSQTKARPLEPRSRTTLYRYFLRPEELLPPCSRNRQYKNTKRCKCWSCHECAVWLAKKKVHGPAAAILRDGADRNLRLGHVVITGPSHALTPAEFQRRYRNLLRRLRRAKRLWAAYVCTWGANATTKRVHRHLVVTAERLVSQKVLTGHAIAVGLGFTKVVRIGSATEVNRAAKYVAANAIEFAQVYPSGDRGVNVVSSSRGHHV